MQEHNETNITEDLDNNDDMIAKVQDIDTTLSFKVSEDAVPKRGWTKKQIRSVWIIGIIATILIVVFSFLLKDMNIFGMFA